MAITSRPAVHFICDGSRLAGTLYLPPSTGRFTEVTDVGAALAGLRELPDIFDAVRLVDSDVYEIGNVTYVRARLHFVHPEAGERMLEQHHLLTIADHRITAIDERGRNARR